MPATPGEPFRGWSSIRMRNLTNDATELAVSCSITDVDPLVVPADTADWDYEAGAEVTLRFEYHRPGGLTPHADDIWVELRLPNGGGVVGDRWLIPAPSGTAPQITTRTIRLDANPTNAVVEALRNSTLEIFIFMRRVAATAWGPFTSGGQQSAPPSTVSAAASTWARGYVRSKPKLQAFTLSKEAFGGAEPALFALTDPAYSQATIDAPFYRAGDTFTIQHGGGVRQGGDVIAAGETDFEVAFTANSGLTARVNNDYPVGNQSVQLVLPTRDFGGDNEYAWADAGHPEGWTRLSDTVLEHFTRMPVDPRATISRHMQLNDPIFGVGKAAPGEPPTRMGDQQANIWQILRNARGEGINLPGDAAGGQLERALRDRFGSLRHSSIVATTTQDGQAGVAAESILFDQPQPGGNWFVESTVRDADGVQAEANNQIVLLALDLQASLTLGNSGEPGDHIITGATIIVSLAMLRIDNGERLTPDVAEVAFVRYTDAGQEHWTGAAWVQTGQGAVTWHMLPYPAPPADPQAFRQTFPTDGWAPGAYVLHGRGGMAGTYMGDEIPFWIVDRYHPHTEPTVQQL